MLRYVLLTAAHIFGALLVAVLLFGVVSGLVLTGYEVGDLLASVEGRAYQAVKAGVIAAVIGTVLAAIIRFAIWAEMDV